MDVDTQNSGAQDVNQNTTPEEGAEKTYEEIEAERKTAITESITNHKEAKQAKEDLNFSRKLNMVLRNPDSLIDIHNEDSELADKLAQEAFGKSYQQLLDQANGKKQDDVDVTGEVQKALKQERQKEEKKKIEAHEDKFFTDKGIALGSDDYNRIIRFYRNFSPDTLQKATDLLEMAHNKFKGTNNPVAMNNNPPAPSNAPSSSQKKKETTPQPSDEQQDVMMSLGITKDDFTKHSTK